MDLYVEREKIIEGLMKCSGITPAKAGAAYLRSIWIKAEGDSISFMSTNANIEFTGTYPARVVVPGLGGVQGKSFVELVRKLPNGELHLSTDETGEHFLLHQGRRKYKLAMYSKDWFQDFSPFPEGESVLWNGSEFSDYIDKVSFCIDDNNVTESMNCLCLKPRENGRIDFCGLNGHRFAIVTFNYEDMAAMLPKEGLLIPHNCLPDIKKWLGDGKIELSLTDKRVCLRSHDGAETLSVPRTLDEFPDYDIFMAKLDDPDASLLRVNRKDAIDALSRISVFNTEADPRVYMNFSPTEVTFSARGSELGSAEEQLESDFRGTLERVAFPTRGMQEIFGHFESDEMELTLTGEEGPCGVKGPSDPGYTVVVMPMKIVEENMYEPED